MRVGTVKLYCHVGHIGFFLTCHFFSSILLFILLNSEYQINTLREAIKKKIGKIWELFPKGGGSAPKSKKSELQIQNIVDRGGGPKFSKKSEFHKQGVQKGIKTLIRP